MSLVVRAARLADTKEIWSLVRALAAYEKMEAHVTGSAEKLAGDLFAERSPIQCLVAQDGARLVGYAIYFPTYSSFRAQAMMWLEDLFVVPEARGKGVGRALMVELAKTAMQRRCWRLDWAVLDWNQPSIEFYERIGARRQNADWLQYGLDEEHMRDLIALSRNT